MTHKENTVSQCYKIVKRNERAVSMSKTYANTVESAFKNHLLKNESKLVSYTMKLFQCQCCQFLINFKGIRLCVRK